MHVKAHGCQQINKEINKEKTPSKGPREGKRKDPSPNKKSHLKVRNPKWGSLSENKTQNLGPKPITNSMKQIMQGDGPETWKDTKLA